VYANYSMIIAILHYSVTFNATCKNVTSAMDQKIYMNIRIIEIYINILK
jgi:hypothetical protein